MGENKRLQLNNPKDLLFLGKCISLCLVSFLAFYSIPNFFNLERSYYIKAYLNWEINHIPLVPEFIFIYFSSYLQAFSPAFFLSKQEIESYVKSFISLNFIACVIFLVFPSKLGFVRPDYVERYNFFFQWLYSVDPPHNLFPSLHIAYSTLACAAIYDRIHSKLALSFLGLWLALLYLSVLFTYQHHIFDIVLGVILTGVVLRKFKFKSCGEVLGEVSP